MLDDLARTLRSQGTPIDLFAAFSYKGRGTYKDLPLPTEVPSVILRPRPGKDDHPPQFFERYHQNWRHDLEDLRFDAVILGGYGSRTHRQVIAACRRRGIPVAVWSDSNLRTQRGKGFLARLKRQLKKRWLKNVIASIDILLTANSRGLAYWRYFGAPRQKVVVCPAYADYAQAEAARRSSRDEVLARAGLKPTDRYLYSAANLTEIKGVDLMMQAFVDGNFSQQGWHFLLAGVGPLESRLKQIAGDHLGKTIHLLGFQQPRHNLAFMAHADLFVLSSRYEAHGIVIGESLATGTPVLASEVCGLGADVIHEGLTGGTFRTGDVQDLIAHLQRLLADPVRLAAMRTTARATFEQWFRRTSPSQSHAHRF